jgi:hypothetical protein
MQAYANVDYKDVVICNRRTEGTEVYDFSFSCTFPE